MLEILPIMLALCLMLCHAYYAQTYTGIIGTSLVCTCVYLCVCMCFCVCVNACVYNCIAVVTVWVATLKYSKQHSYRDVLLYIICYFVS